MTESQILCSIDLDAPGKLVLTLMVGYVATHATSPAVRKVPYDAIKDFTPIAMVGGTRNMLVVHPSLPVSDLKLLHLSIWPCVLRTPR